LVVQIIQGKLKYHNLNNIQLIIGLRGCAIYGPILQGKVSGEIKVSTTGTDNEDLFYKFFPETDGLYQ